MKARLYYEAHINIDPVFGLVQALQANDFAVRRYKIEDTVLDSRTRDELNLLSFVGALYR